MFFMQLDGEDLARLTRLANLKSMSLERVARLVFLRGMRLLTRSGDGEVPATGEVVRSSKTDRVREYIRLNWTLESDDQMATTLGYSKGYICFIRSKMGLSRPRHERCENAKETRHQLRLERFVQLDGQIREHYLTKDDAEIGRMMNPSVPRTVVCARRLKLGLQRPRGGANRRGGVRDQIDAAELARMVNSEGYTMTEYLNLKGLHCSRERLRQIASELGVNTSDENRAPEWKIRRKARQLGKPRLCDKEWLTRELAAASSLADLEAKIELDDYSLRFFLKAHGLTHRWIRTKGRETAEIVCTNCEKRFKRSRRWLKAIESREGGLERHRFFCSFECVGQYRKMHPDKWVRKAG